VVQPVNHHTSQSDWRNMCNPNACPECKESPGHAFGCQTRSCHMCGKFHNGECKLPTDCNKPDNSGLGVKCHLELNHDGKCLYRVAEVLAACAIHPEQSDEQSHECAACKTPLGMLWVQAASGQRCCCFECMGAIL